jgi:2-polyprenyl-6-methoxyphenol hydroxylase-like FAD-dependent oxidoreductase
MRTAVVVGAGVGGLAAAGALARADWQVTLIERAERLRGSAAALFLWPNGVTALAALGVTLGDIAFPVPAGGIRRPDGRWLVPAGGEAGPDQPVVVHGDDLRDALMADLGDRIDIRTGTEVTAVHPAARVPTVATAKHTFTADLVVAADGAGSLIRRRLAPRSALAAAGYTSWRAVIPWYRVPALPDPVPPAGEMLGAGQRFRHATLGERGGSASTTRGGVYWAAVAPGAARPESPATQLSLLRRWFAGWQSPVGELLAATEPHDLVQQAGEELRPLPRQFGIPVGAGGFVLLGDAAHVSTPNLTQGACLALEDAATLAAFAGDPRRSLGEVLAGYTQARRARVERVARTSRRLGLVLQARGRWTVRARDAALGRLPHRLLGAADAATSQWRPPPR